MFHAPEKHRFNPPSAPHLASSAADGNNGCFTIPRRGGKAPLRVICSDGAGWEHVSVSLPHRCPTWQEMCEIKALFWDAEDCVVQYHPPESAYVNNHSYCLHLWRRPEGFPAPPSIMVGVQK